MVELGRPRGIRVVRGSRTLEGGPELGQEDRPEELGPFGAERSLGEVQEEQPATQELVEGDRVRPLTERFPEHWVGRDLADLVERGDRERVVERGQVDLEELTERALGDHGDETPQRSLSERSE